MGIDVQNRSLLLQPKRAGRENNVGISRIRPEAEEHPIPETRIGLGLSLRNKKIIWPQSALPCVPEVAQSDKAPRKTTADRLHAAFWEGVVLLCYVHYVLNT